MPAYGSESLTRLPPPRSWSGRRLGVCSVACLSVLALLLLLPAEHLSLTRLTAQAVPRALPAGDTLPEGPAFQMYFDDLLDLANDRVFRRADTAVWRSDCDALMSMMRRAPRLPTRAPEKSDKPKKPPEKASASSKASTTTPPPIVIHTGTTESGGSRGVAWKDYGRKTRLGVMSFLASQELARTVLRVWCAPDGEAQIRENLSPMLTDGRFAPSINISLFNPGYEFQRMMPTPEAAKLVMQIYNGSGGTMKASTSDLMRIALLHNYGGIWIDTDVLLVNSFAPLTDIDWVYEGGQPKFYNPALLSAASPQSPFMKAAADRIAKMDLKKLAGKAQGIFTFGPNLMGQLLREDARLAVVLPPCFFDAAWGGAHRAAVWWGDFFQGNATIEQVRYLTPGSGPAFAYHWHGRWEKPISNGSVADEMEKVYLQYLRLRD